MATQRAQQLAEDPEDRDQASHDGLQLVPKVVEGVKHADDKLVAFVKERPLVALGAALAVGYVIGRVLTR
jgi:ElaB/YqjD/DUF883 family membrane-anchored ribosome-binding protein